MYMYNHTCFLYAYNIPTCVASKLYIFNPRRACAARVTVVGSVCVCVC